MFKESEARQMIIEAGQRLLESKLVSRTWGNISAKISDNEFLITPSGHDFKDLKSENLVKVTIDNCAWEGDIRPSKEKMIHAAAYALRSDVNVIVHTHQFYASAVAAECRDTEFAPCAEYALPGTAKLKRNVEAKIIEHPDSKVFLMARHGALVLAADMDEAFELAGGLEIKSRLLVDARVPRSDLDKSSMFNIKAVESTQLPFVRIVTDRYIQECCTGKVKLGVYLDDFAQIAGTELLCVKNDTNAARRALLGYRPTPAFPTVMGGKVTAPMTGALGRMETHPALNTVIGRSAVLVKGVGAVCTGKTEKEVDTVALVVSKNCAAACYIKDTKPIGVLDARVMRCMYLARNTIKKERE